LQTQHRLQPCILFSSKNKEKVSTGRRGKEREERRTAFGGGDCGAALEEHADCCRGEERVNRAEDGEGARRGRTGGGEKESLDVPLRFVRDELGKVCSSKHAENVKTVALSTFPRRKLKVTHTSTPPE
jgi:hypothetical protein